MANDLITMIMIMPYEAYDNLTIAIGQLEENFLIEVRYAYALGHQEYMVVELNVLTLYFEKQKAIAFLLKYLSYTLIRVEGSPCIFCKREGDLVDLYYDEYSYYNGNWYFKKDLLSAKERYNLILKSLGTLYQEKDLYLESPGLFNGDMIETLMKEDSPELFIDSLEYSLIDKKTEEVLSVNIMKVIPLNFFKIILLKKLDNCQRNII